MGWKRELVMTTMYYLAQFTFEPGAGGNSRHSSVAISTSYLSMMLQLPHEKR